MQLKNFLAAALCTADTRLRRGVLLLFVSALVSVSCDCFDRDPIFEYPHDGGIDPTLVTVNITYHCCKDIPLYTIVHLTKSKQDEIVRRYYFEVLSEDGEAVKTLYIEREYNDLSDITMSLSLPAGSYKAVMWQDCTSEYGVPFYNPANLKQIKIPSADGYYGCTDTKDASCATTLLDIPETDEWNVQVSYEENLERPLSKISFISTDGPLFVHKCSEYLQTKTSATISEIRERFYLRFFYEGYILTGYNAERDEFNGSKMGYSFDGILEATDNPSNMFLGYDYVFVNGEEGVFWIVLQIIDSADGKIIVETNKIRVPVKRGQETIVMDDLLTTYWGQSIAIDPGFNGEFNFIIQ